jgi:hypothetical protein
MSQSQKNPTNFLKFVISIESFGTNGYIAWIEGLKGMVVQGDSKEEVMQELYKSLKVKIAYGLGVSISTLNDMAERAMNEPKIDDEEKSEINLVLA